MVPEINPPIVAEGEITSFIGILIRAPAGVLSKDFIVTKESAQAYKEENPDKPLLILEMPCGSRAEYPTYDDIPEVDVPCPCGNPNHWLIKYEIS